MPGNEEHQTNVDAQSRQGFPPLSGFCFFHRASALGYPAIASIRQALLLCRELVVGISAAPDPLTPVLRAWSRRELRIRLVEIDLGEVPSGNAAIAWLRRAYSAALDTCSADWVVRLDLDELFHERDVPIIQGAVQLAEAKGASALKTSFREIAADWRFAVEPAPFDQVRIWHRLRASPAWDGSQAIAHGPVLDLTRVRCWHLDLLMPAPLRAIKLARSYHTHFPQVETAGRDPLYKHQLLVEQAPEAFAALGWRMPERMVYLGGVDAYPHALRHTPRWLARFTHPAAQHLLASGMPTPGTAFPLPNPEADT